MRIELLGPSGVGKSTILRIAESSRDPGSWLGPDEIAGRTKETRTTEFRRQTLDDPSLREFIEACIEIVHRLVATPSHRIGALAMLRDSAALTRAAELLDPATAVHDELLLHRSFSVLPQSADIERDAATYFSLVPVPAAAVVVSADAATLRARIAQRGSLPNCYAGLDDAGFERSISNVLRAAEIAVETLRERGVEVLELDASGTAEHSAQTLHAFIGEHMKGSTMPDTTGSPESDEQIRERLLAASGSFRKKAGRHELRTRDVMYCAFSTPSFTVSKDEAQRDAARRLERFGITAGNARGKTALDLGSNAGAMLFELNNLGIASGLGVEYDQDKVDLATEIAALSDLDRLTFQQGDIDELEAAKLGTFDIVLALAIEGHVQDPARLYRLLGQVTGSTLYFEGNGNCDIEAATAQLKSAGFTKIESIGFCDDDRDPRNNKRPMLVATKAKKRSLFRRG